MASLHWGLQLNWFILILLITLLSFCFTDSLEMELENKAIAYLFNVAFRNYVSVDLYQMLEEGEHSEKKGISHYHFKFNQPWNPDVDCVVSFMHVAATVICCL